MEVTVSEPCDVIGVELFMDIIYFLIIMIGFYETVLDS